MLNLSLKEVRSVLCIGAHADDIEIGCGGTIVSLLGAASELSVSWVVLSASPARKVEAQESAERFLQGTADTTVEVCSFRDGFFPYEVSLKEQFEQMKARYKPDLILTHRRGDRHQDHRTVCELTWNTFRDHLILEYEIPKWDGDLGKPNVYMPLSTGVRREKVRRLMESFESQQQKHWYEPELFESLMRLRGMECGAPDRYAEAFFAPKVRVTI